MFARGLALQLALSGRSTALRVRRHMREVQRLLIDVASDMRAPAKQGV
jgi:hypothetical protein